MDFLSIHVFNDSNEILMRKHSIFQPYEFKFETGAEHFSTQQLETDRWTEANICLGKKRGMTGGVGKSEVLGFWSRVVWGDLGCGRKRGKRGRALKELTNRLRVVFQPDVSQSDEFPMTLQIRSESVGMKVSLFVECHGWYDGKPVTRIRILKVVKHIMIWATGDLDLCWNDLWP